MKQIKLLLLCVFLIVGCSKPTKNKNGIKHIEITLGNTTVSIDSNLTYKYFANNYATLKGFYEGKINRQLWDSLTMKLDSIKIISQNGVNCSSEFDLGLEFFIKTNKLHKHVTSGESCLPAQTRSVFYWIANTYKYANLHKVKDSINFNVAIYKSPIANSVHIKLPSNLIKPSN